MTRNGQISPLLTHGVAAALTLLFAWYVSVTWTAKSSVQFVAPLLVIMAVHFTALWFSGGLMRGFAMQVYARSAQTTALMAATFLVASLGMPGPAAADAGDAINAALMVVFCVFVIVVVVGVCALVIYTIFKLFAALFGGKSDTDDTDTLRDGGSLAATVLVLVALSLEGLPETYAFNSEGEGTTTLFIDASPDVVWETMQTATSPAFPLPTVLSSFPQPVGIPTDEGTNLGANRVVTFAGREGAGALALQVVSNDADGVLFEVQSDTTPYAEWVDFRSVRYVVTPVVGGTQLRVEIAFTRKLSPAWVFNPAIRGAASLAAQVLVTDVKTRAEAAS